MYRLLLALFTLLLLTACSPKQLYTFGNTAHITPSSQQQTSQQFIGVEQIKLPIYMMDSPIYKKDSPYHLVEIKKASWTHSMDKHLTNMLIAYLQKSLNNPNIYAYPWSSSPRTDKRISLTIANFIAHKGVINLDATYQILDKKTKKSSNYLFNHNEPIQNKSIEAMMEAMEKIYFKLAKQIKQKL